MLFKLISALAVIAFTTSCASHGEVRANRETSSEKNSQRFPAESKLNSRVNLLDIVSLNSGYWDVKRGTSTYFGRYKAFILATEGDYYTLKVFAESDGLVEAPTINMTKRNENIAERNDDSKYSLVAENNKFIWGSDWAGTEPSLAVNGRGSLMIVSGNEGIGRYAWEQKVTVQLNPTSSVLEVIGFDYTSRDKLDLSSVKCSYNFGSGKAVVDVYGPEYDLDKDRPIARPTRNSQRFNISKIKTSLNDWKDSSEMPVLSVCQRALESD